MTPRPAIGTPLARLLAATVLALATGPAMAQGVEVAILPAGQTVAPGSTFTLSLEVTASGSPFNGFDAVVEYDPAALTFVPLAPTSQQIGAYLLGRCASGPFHYFNAAGDSLSISTVLLCQGVSLPGPGQIYTLKFTASNTPQVTWVRLRNVRFYDAGLFVTPVFDEDAPVGIGVPVAVEAEVPRPGGFSLRAAPNPFRGQASIRIVSPIAGMQRIFVRDVMGRRVRDLGKDYAIAGTRHIQWDGRDDTGRLLPAGVYRIVLETETSVVSSRIALLR